MRMNTIIRLPDGREGTITWRHLDGEGGIWGRHHFDCDEGFNDVLPPPQFMLREKSIENLLRGNGIDSHRPDLECVGTDYEIVDDEEEK